ncbi:unnamed protein product [Caenorhabditis brenneri]
MTKINSIGDAAALFPSFQNLDFLIALFSFFEKNGLRCLEIEFYIAIIGLFLTTFHVYILTRKSMMISSVISIMICIGVCDGISMICAISTKNMVYSFYRDECTPPLTFIKFHVFTILGSIRDDVMRCSMWLGLLMAFIRYLVVRFAARPGFQQASTLSFGTDRTTVLVIAMTVTFFIASLPSGIFTVFKSIYADEGFIYLSALVDHFCKAILTLNATIHCFICFAMSTDYRKTVMGIWKIGYKNRKYGLLSVQLEFYIAIIGLLLTMCHVFVLTRKPMMTSSIISIMIGIGMFDALSMTFAISLKNLTYNFYRDECTPPFTLFEFYAFLVLAHSRDNMMRCSIWLGLVMALIRILSLRFTSKPGFRRMNNISFGFSAAFVAFFFSCVITFSIAFRSRVKEGGVWTPDENCQFNSSEVFIIYQQQTAEIYLANDRLLLRIVTFVNGVSTKLIPSILLPIFTFILILQIQQARRKITISSVHVQKRTDKTTYLVIFMSATFFIASLPAGVFSLFQVMYSDTGFLWLTSLADHFCTMILTVNASIHCVICFTISTDYRKQTKMILGIRQKKIMTISQFT